VQVRSALDRCAPTLVFAYVAKREDIAATRLASGLGWGGSPHTKVILRNKGVGAAHHREAPGRGLEQPHVPAGVRSRQQEAAEVQVFSILGDGRNDRVAHHVLEGDQLEELGRKTGNGRNKRRGLKVQAKDASVREERTSKLAETDDASSPHECQHVRRAGEGLGSSSWKNEAKSEKKGEDSQTKKRFFQMATNQSSR